MLSMAAFKKILASIVSKKPSQKGLIAQSKASIASGDAPEGLVAAAKRGAYGQGGYSNTDTSIPNSRSQP